MSSNVVSFAVAAATAGPLKFTAEEMQILDGLIYDAKCAGAVKDHVYEKVDGQPRLTLTVGKFEAAPIVYITKTISDFHFVYSYHREPDGLCLSSNKLENILQPAKDDLKNLGEEIKQQNEHFATLNAQKSEPEGAFPVSSGPVLCIDNTQ